MAFLRDGKEVDTCVTTLFIFRYLERMGDALLNIGEAILLAILGEKIKIRQFEALQQTLCHAEISIAPEKLEVNSFWGNRSGCNISRVGSGIQPGGVGEKRQEGLFKSGSRSKIVQERDNIEKWTMIMPGLVPRIYSFHEDGNCSSILVEFIAGQTLESIIITRPLSLIVKALQKLETTLRGVWEKSLITVPAGIDYMGQLLKRSEDIMAVHPDIFRDQQVVSGLEVPSALILVENCRAWEKTLAAPFTVFGHGDLNINNILYDEV
ncbi:MAG TPA: hypothetical protein ENN66_09945 [Proteobacteria bacterium]|nr:hypothetical protein [Pseudomonadota bacterium]